MALWLKMWKMRLRIGNPFNFYTYHVHLKFHFIQLTLILSQLLYTFNHQYQSALTEVEMLEQ